MDGWVDGGVGGMGRWMAGYIMDGEWMVYRQVGDGWMVGG
jgi:hypothetical protein